ncbi:zinc carboxypeptidase [Gillisia sp. Hel_I_86]|uniref:M14 family metallopeptidase n=1 Tax=Gillisia sp. Hel_I_86 TaxID=1249981 RepID=UPI0011992832|nr:M14 metallopeptidase family protein [Gillisia sp. Hel_I_86]TVZ28508.1 zinc carboxypeptidase [Gillisia sp. Hel_I_86]
MINIPPSILRDYAIFKEAALNGRYINATHISVPLKKAASNFESEILGESTLGEPIHLIKVGTGKVKILMWSQMHGNESTTTKAVFDMLNVFSNCSQDSVVKNMVSNCTLYIIPMLNPDGARAYTRVNANEIDLNRDAKDLSQVESRVLRAVFDDFQPDFCFNLHDQRTIFSAGSKEFPATLSFLTPSEDLERTVTPSRTGSMKVIGAIYKDLSQLIPNRIGRYDDGFNANCTGDAFQSMGVPTILFEAGHSYGDYARDKTREYVFYALFSALNAISTQSYKKFDTSVYFNIPENEKLFYDVILRNAEVNGQIVDIAIQFKEILMDTEIKFLGSIENISPKIAFFAHKEIQCDFERVTLPDNKELIENVIVNKILLKNEFLMINYEKN